MAVPSNRSPSPLSSRNISQSRNSESSNPATRRSFSSTPFPRPLILSNPRSFNPVTPANSPAGFRRRNSTSNLQGFDEKENEKDQSLKRVESVRSPGNGSKNFMAPTISTVSKFSPSPRKKVLVDRNDPLRTSISLSEGNATFFSAISPEIVGDLDQQKGEVSIDSTLANSDRKDDVLECLRVLKSSSKRVTFLEVPSDSEIGAMDLKQEKVTISSDECFRVDDSGSKNNLPSRFPVSPIIAPLDTDPYVPLYDPKTNLLSPRPQFLHYKPNPRIELLFDKEEKGIEITREAKKLEDTFMLEVLSGSFSDTENVTDGSSSSEDSQKFDYSSSFENVLPEGTELHAPESLPTFVLDDSKGSSEAINSISKPISHGISEGNPEKQAEEKTIVEPISSGTSKGDEVYDVEMPKPRRFFNILMSVFLLLVLVIGCFSPFMNSDILRSPKMPETSKMVLVTRENVKQLGVKFKKLSFDSISHIHLLINNLGRGNNLRHVKFMNLTDLQDYYTPVGDCLEEDYLLECRAFKEEEDVKEEEQEEDSEIEPFEEEQPVTELCSDESHESESETFWDMEASHADAGIQSQGNSEGDCLEEDYLLECRAFKEEEDVKEEEQEEDSEIEPFEEEQPVTELCSDESHDSESETFWDMEASSSSSHADAGIQSQGNSEGELAPISGVIFLEKAYGTDSEVIESDSSEVLDMNHDSVAQMESSSSSSSSTADMHPETSSLRLIYSIVVEEKPHETMIGSGNKDDNRAGLFGGIATFVTVLLLSVSALFYGKQNKFRDPNPVSKVHEKVAFHPKSVSASLGADIIDVDAAAEESCSSEIRSSSAHSRKQMSRLANEVQSPDIMKYGKYSNRESLASSSGFSTGSPSCGSFTTYERIPSKNANGEDEIMTPVRRSSRIRNQVTSS